MMLSMKAHGVLDICISKYFDGEALACIAASSKGLRAAVTSALATNASALLRAVKAAGLHGNKHATAVEWICSLIVSSTSLQAASGDLLLTPLVPIKAAAALAKAGLQYTYQQVVEAAIQRTAGVEVWIQVGAVADAPQLARLVTLKESYENLRLSNWAAVQAAKKQAIIQALDILEPSELPSLLCLVANCRHNYHSACIMLTALLGGNNDNTHPQLRPEQQQLLQEQVTVQLLQQLLMTCKLAQVGSCFLQPFCQLPAAALLDQAFILAELQCAMRGRKRVLADALTSLPQAKQLGFDALLGLLQSALLHGNTEGAYDIVRLLRSVQMPAASIACGLQRIIDSMSHQQSKRDSLTYGLYTLMLDTLLAAPAVADIEAAALARILYSALLQRHFRPDGCCVITKLLECSAAQHIPSEHYAAAIMIAVEQGDLKILQQLCKHQAAQQMKASDVGSLLDTALLLRHHPAGNDWLYSNEPWAGIGKELLELPAAQLLPADTIEQLLRHVTFGDHSRDLATLLLDLPNAEHIQAETVAHLLQQAVNHHYTDLVETLCKLRSAQSLQSTFLIPMLETAIQQYDNNCMLHALTQLPHVADGITSFQLTRLVKLAVHRDLHASLLGTILDWERSGKAVIDPDDLVSIMRDAMRRKCHAGVLTHLGDSRAACRISTEALVHLMHLALERLEYPSFVVQSLCDCPRARQMQPDQLAELISMALRQPAATKWDSCEIAGTSFAKNNQQKLLPAPWAENGALDALCGLATPDVDTATSSDMESECEPTFEQGYRESGPKSPAQDLNHQCEARPCDCCQQAESGAESGPGSESAESEPCWEATYVRLSPAAVQDLLMLAVQLSREHAVQRLCSLEGAQRLGTTSGLKLLQQAIACCGPSPYTCNDNDDRTEANDKIGKALCSLPGVGGLDSSVLASVLLEAVQEGDACSRLVVSLCKLRSAGSLQKCEVDAVVTAAGQIGGREMLQAVAMLQD